VTKTKKKYDCRYCGEQFDKSWQASIHIDKNHYRERRLREVSCWRCAGWIDPNKTNTCACGFVHPLIQTTDSERTTR